jgi:hypothetical protein
MEIETANNNNYRKVDSIEQSVPSLHANDEETDFVSNGNNDISREKLEMKQSKDKRKKDKVERHKKEKDKKHKSKDKKQQKSTTKAIEEGVRVPEKEDNNVSKSDDEHSDNLSGIEKERNGTSYDQEDFDNDDNEGDHASKSAQNEDIESESVSNNNRISDDVNNDDNQTDNTTLIRQIKKDYYKKIERVFTGKLVRSLVLVLCGLC